MSTIEEQKRLVDELCREWPKMLMVPIQQRQAASSRDTQARGPVWISRGEFAAPPETNLRDALCQVADELSAPEHILPKPDEIPVQNVRAEFAGVRSGVGERVPEAKIPESEKLERLQSECQRDLTILYAHGGGLYFSSPAEYRSVTTRLARLTGSRVASIGYRLAPQYTFPCPLLDVLVAYANLLYPPPNATHKPVSASRVVFAGNSSGATLIFSLTKFLLAWNQRADPSILFHGRRLTLPLPAGIATVSGWCDQTDALPSWVDGGQHDILSKLQPALWPEYPIDSVWPSRPPREHPYTRAVNLDHELITPAAVYDWTGAPPMWFAVGGEERALDGNKAVASRAAHSGIPVTWFQYEGMPHEWMILLRKFSQAKHCFDSWGEAVLSFVGEQKPSRQGATRGHAAMLLKMPDCQLEPMAAVEQLASLDFEEMRKRMKKKNAARPIWTGTGARNVKAMI